VYLFAAADINWSIIKLWPLKAGVGRHRAQSTGHRAQGTGHKAQGTGHRAQGTGHRAQGTGHSRQEWGGCLLLPVHLYVRRGGQQLLRARWHPLVVLHDRRGRGGD